MKLRIDTILEERKRAGRPLPVKDYCERVGISRSLYYKHRNGSKAPQRWYLRRAAKVLRVPQRDLFEQSDAPADGA